jgi:predicted acyltransferase
MWPGCPDTPRSLVRRSAQEDDLQQVQANLGAAIGFGLIVIGLVVLLVGLGWSATRRLRNLPDDPRGIRALIVIGLVLAAIGVIVGAVTVGAS